MTEEEREKGLVDSSAYAYYFKAVSNSAVAFVLFAMLAVEGMRVRDRCWVCVCVSPSLSLWRPLVCHVSCLQ